jgi:hypothetical protein
MEGQCGKTNLTTPKLSNLCLLGTWQHIGASRFRILAAQNKLCCIRQYGQAQVTEQYEGTRLRDTQQSIVHNVTPKITRLRDNSVDEETHTKSSSEVIFFVYDASIT